MKESASNTIVIGIGSNADAAHRNVHNAVEWCRKTFIDMNASSIYSTLPFGKKATAVGLGYFNCVVKARTILDAGSVEQLLKDYESAHGRDLENRRKGIVPIDLDLVMYGNYVLRPQEIDRDYFSRGFNELESSQTGPR